MPSSRTHNAAFAVLGLLALALPASARSGGVAIYNDCDVPIVGTTVTTGIGASAPYTLAPQTWHWEAYQHSGTGGTSMKLHRQTIPAITQLEYTFGADGLIYYDLSNVDCGPTSQTDKADCPFLAGGMFLHSSRGCPTKTCASGDARCHDAYNVFNDDWATAGCRYKGQNLVLYACRSTILT